MDTTHQATTLSVQVGVDFLLKGGLVEVATADGNTKSLGLLLGFASDILEDSVRGIDTTALTEERSDSSARTLGGN